MNKIAHPIEPEELMAYLDGELPADRATATASHLGACAECQSLVTELRSISQSLKTWRIEPPQSITPPPIATALAGNRPALPSVSSPSRQRNWRELLGRRWPTIAWAGTVAAVCLVVVGTLRFQGRNANNVYSQVGASLSDDSSKASEHVFLGRIQPATPASKPVGGGGGDHDKLEMFAKLQQAPPVQSSGAQQNPPSVEHEVIASGPMIIRTAQLSLITKEFDKARANIEAILKRHRGYVGELKTGGATGSGRTLTATLRVPADQLDATLAEVKTLGRVESESQSGQNVTSQYVDLQARLSNARNTEQRLTDLLRNRTGKLSDVLEVEQELDRVRGEIEQMEAERKNMSNQVSFAHLERDPHGRLQSRVAGGTAFDVDSPQ